jgi:hypothetical protein
LFLVRADGAERRDVEIVPGVSHLLVAAVVDEAGAEHALVVAIEDVRTIVGAAAQHRPVVPREP